MNWLKDKLCDGSVLSGIWLAQDSTATVEMLGHLGFDWLLLDMEHGLGDESTVQHQLQALRATSTPAVVRVAANDPVLIKRALDMGASAIMVPFVNTASQAQQAIQALRYPPDGIRGVASLTGANQFGINFPEYLAQANQKLLTITQIETPQGVENASEIAQVDGIDILFVGPLDLSVNMGIPMQYDNPKLHEAFTRVIQACKTHNKTAGIFLPNIDLAPTAVAQGFTFLAVGTEMDFLRETLKTVVNQLHQLPSKP